VDLYDAAHLAAWPVLGLAMVLLFAGLEFVGAWWQGRKALRYALASAAFLLALVLLGVAYQLAYA
jgi:hypothetical protein